MLKLKSLYKGIIKYPISSGLNILNLVVAFSGIMTLILYVSYENSFDTFNNNYHSIYKIQVGKDGTTVPAVMAPIIRKNIPEIEGITPFSFYSSHAPIAKLGSKKMNYPVKVLCAENSVFDIFTFPFILGEKGKALTKPNTIVLTQKLSSKLFGNKNPVGKKILLNKIQYTVTGVIRDIPETSSFTADCITSFKTLTQSPNAPANTWEEWSYEIFCKFGKGVNYHEVSRKINNIDEFKKYFKQNNNAESRTIIYLQPLKKLHFSKDYNFRTVNRKVLDVLILLSIILALMGIFNFINLSISQSLPKAKTFSVMRVLGASREIIIIQILAESVLISLFALALAFLLHTLMYSSLEDIFNIKGLSFGNRTLWYFYFGLMAVIIGIAAATYPARVISSPHLLQSGKGGYRNQKKGRFVKNLLIVLQFVIAIALLIVSIGIEKQINYWHNFDIGIQTKNIVYLHTTSQIRKHYKAFAKEMITDPNIIQYTYSQSVPGNVNMGWGRNIDGQQISLKVWPVDENFFGFFGLKVVKGRPFSKTIGADNNKFILNQAAVKKFGWKKPLEKVMSGFGFNGNIIGVVKDFNFSSLKESIQPMQFWLTNTRKYVLILKLKHGNFTQALKHMKRTWTQFEPDIGFNYRFLNDSLNNLYTKEERIANFIKYVSLWTILLALMGLLGIVIFTARQKTKEIGIRKVNGASVSEIMTMLNKDFIKWVALSFVIAAPIAYYALSKWLQNFAYKTSMSWWIFVLAGIIVLAIVLLTVSWQTFRVARKNPIEALRYE